MACVSVVKPSGDSSRRTYLISYNLADLSWAEWTASELEVIGQLAIIQAWDFQSGKNFVLELQNATVRSGYTIADYSVLLNKHAATLKGHVAATFRCRSTDSRRSLSVCSRSCLT